MEIRNGCLFRVLPIMHTGCCFGRSGTYRSFISSRCCWPIRHLMRLLRPLTHLFWPIRMRRANHCNMVLSQHQIFHTGNRCRMRISAHCQQIATCGLIWPFPVSGIKIKTSQFWMLPEFLAVTTVKTGRPSNRKGACRIRRVWRIPCAADLAGKLGRHGRGGHSWIIIRGTA